MQDTFVVALTRITSVQDPTAIGGWLRAVLVNACRLRLRDRRKASFEQMPDLQDPAPDPEQLAISRDTRDWIWSCMASLSEEERLTLALRHFTRCASYAAIASVTAVPVGTVRSRLHRAHTRLADALQRAESSAQPDQQHLEAERCAAWEDFYEVVLDAPEPDTYRGLFSADLRVRDGDQTWAGIEAWAAEERPAIELGVRVAVVGITAAQDLTVLEIDFTNPPEAPGHCPPRATFVHSLAGGRTRQLAIHYV